MKKSIFFSSLILAIIVSFAFGYFIGQAPTEQLKENIKKEVVSELTPETVYNLAEATVKEVGENYLIVIPSPEQNILNLVFPKEVKINIDEKTIIKEMLSGEDSKNLFDTSPATLNDIKTNDFLQIASSDKNIKGVKEFTAILITFESAK